MSYRLVLARVVALVMASLSCAHAQEKAVWKEEARALAFAPDGKILAVGTRSAVLLLNMDGEKHATFDTGSQVQSLAFTADGRHLAASVYQDRSLRIWNVVTGSEASQALPEYGDGSVEDTSAVGWLPDSRTLITLGRRWSEKKEVRFVGVWDMSKGRRLPIPIPVVPELPCLAVSSSGSAFAFAGREKEPIIWLWPKLTGVIEKPKLLKGGHPQMINALAFSPDGKQLASASRDMIRIWDVASGKEQSSIGREFDGTKHPSGPKHQSVGMDIFCLAFLPDNSDRSVNCLLALGVSLGGFPSRSTGWRESREIRDWNGRGGSGWRGGQRAGRVFGRFAGSTG